MSLDVNIPIHAPLNASKLVARTKEVLVELLQHQGFTLYVEAIEKGAVCRNIPLVLDDESPLLCFYLDNRERDETRAEVFVMDMEGEKLAVASMNGGGGMTYPRFVMTMACAIAAAFESNSRVEGGLVKRLDSEQPQELINLLKCRDTNSTIDAAIKEVAQRISSVFPLENEQAR